MRKKLIFLSMGLVILGILLWIGSYKAIQYFAKPQAPTLSLVLATRRVDTPSPTVLIETQHTSQKTLQAAEPDLPTISPTIVVNIAPTQASPVCSQSGTWTILALGRSTHTQPGGTQSIRLVNVNFNQESVLIYSFPPELTLDTPSLVADYNIKYSYLEDIFPKIVKAAGESQETDFKATQALAQVLLDTFGIPIEHYITIQDDILMEAVDALGGIYVTLPEDFTMPENSKYKGQVIKAGIQLFDGDMLHAYVSYIGKNEDEFVRLARQNAVLEGMRKKMLDPSTFLKIIELYSIYKKYVVTDLSLEQMTSLGCLARLVPRDQITMKEPQIDEILYWEDGSMHFKDLASTAIQLQALFGVAEK